MLNSRALLIATVVGTVLQVIMVVAGHSNNSIMNLFAVGGMGFSLIAGVIYAVTARGGSTSSLAIGGLRRRRDLRVHRHLRVVHAERRSGVAARARDRELGGHGRDRRMARPISGGCVSRRRVDAPWVIARSDNRLSTP